MVRGRGGIAPICTLPGRQFSGSIVLEVSLPLRVVWIAVQVPVSEGAQVMRNSLASVIAMV